MSIIVKSIIENSERIIFYKSLIIFIFLNRINFDLNQLSDGKYFIRLTNQYGNVKTFKFVKIN